MVSPCLKTSPTVVIVGSGMASLTAACLLAKDGFSVKVIEQNYLPGGCTSSYWRKGFVFESGATTLVGLQQGMPLHYLLQQIGIEIPAWKLDLPMQVHLKNGQIVNRYQELEAWIREVERIFGKKNQRAFWQFCYRVSQFVWQTSLKQTAFPPATLSDWWLCATRATIRQLSYARYAFFSMEYLLKKFDLLDNLPFVEFVNEQLLITAQNYLNEVNILFGATALCYTNYDNFYVQGGLIHLVQPLVNYLQSKGSEVILREKVEKIIRKSKHYEVQTNKGSYIADFIISGIPINNTLQIYEGTHSQKFAKKLLQSEYLHSAFQMGIGFKLEEENLKHLPPNCIHFQIHLPQPLTEIGSKSIFVSLSHPKDITRSDYPNMRVASVSTHISHPAKYTSINKTQVEKEIIQILAQKKWLNPENIVYSHSSTQKSWEKWTGRMYGFVGGYPQYFRIKPWQMIEARLDHYKAYICGDTTYPGQGIPGTVLSGIIAYQKLKRDWF
ncbi:MAG: NAD(P)/FAD-dependent oxidoreductase [Microscillaceae bacterium]|nr:NAD(P)/FAD-dependent oxidoreductase [Microscillaceae bacterium]MDW8460005.1 NAD(P)/FAD-dependent oxidoreductase [Cytophagales bacterium]